MSLRVIDRGDERGYESRLFVLLGNGWRRDLDAVRPHPRLAELKWSGATDQVALDTRTRCRAN
jgi:hypothetical protein